MRDAVAAAGAAHCEVAHFRRVQPFCNQLCIRRLKGRNPDELRRVPPFGDAVADQGDSAHAVPPETGEFPGRKRGRLRDLRLRPVIDFKLVPGEEVPAIEADQSAAGPAGERIRSLRRKQHRADNHFITAVTEASQDAYELVQRQAIRFIAKNGDRRLIPALIRLSIANNTSDRCNFNVMTALACFPKEDLLAEFDRQFDAPSVQYLDKNNLRGKIRNTIAHSADRLTTDIDKVVKGEASEKDRTFTIRALRNTLPHHKVPELLVYLQDCGDGNTQILLLEALGWHTVSCHAADIAATALKMSEDASLPNTVRQEALKTYRRIHEK